MNQVDEVTILAEKAWVHQKQFAYLKALPKEIQIEAAAVASYGKSPMMIARALGVSKRTVRDWGEKFKVTETVSEFREVPIVSEVTPPTKLEVRVVAQINDARIEITCSNFDLARALIKRLGA